MCTEPPSVEEEGQSLLRAATVAVAGVLVAALGWSLLVVAVAARQVRAHRRRGAQERGEEAARPPELHARVALHRVTAAPLGEGAHRSATSAEHGSGLTTRAVWCGAGEDGVPQHDGAVGGAAAARPHSPAQGAPAVHVPRVALPIEHLAAAQQAHGLRQRHR
eukprot:scaffold3370_cov359-Prasinococcus_capsulatus_cf.AAC.9